VSLRAALPAQQVQCGEQRRQQRAASSCCTGCTASQARSPPQQQQQQQEARWALVQGQAMSRQGRCVAALEAGWVWANTQAWLQQQVRDRGAAAVGSVWQQHWLWGWCVAALAAG
jgi:hypothetical protein